MSYTIDFPKIEFHKLWGNNIVVSPFVKEGMMWTMDNFNFGVPNILISDLDYGRFIYSTSREFMEATRHIAEYRINKLMEFADKLFEENNVIY